MSICDPPHITEVCTVISYHTLDLADDGSARTHENHLHTRVQSVMYDTFCRKPRQNCRGCVSSPYFLRPRGVCARVEAGGQRIRSPDGRIVALPTQITGRTGYRHAWAEH